MTVHSLDQIDTLTVANARTALAQGIAAIQAGNTVFDLASVKTTDSAAVAVLLAWQRAARKAGVSLSYINMPASLVSLSDLYGVDEFLVASPANLQHH
jgi:phospholipid transport system transporter-binding protein